MSTTKKIADTLKQHLADVADRGKLFGQALKVRADMAAIRRRLRTTYAELGEDLGAVARAYAEDVRARRFPGPEHCFPPPGRKKR